MSRLRRLSAALAAALLLFSTQADIYASSHCAHHSAQAAAPAESGGHGHHGDPDSQSNESEHSGTCTCLGMCAASSILAFDTQPAGDASFALTFDVASRIAAFQVELPVYYHHLIPFATAPPVVS